MKPFERVRLGRSQVKVTRLGMGCAPLGGLFERVPDRQAQWTLDRAYDLGVRYFDTAPLYGSGLSEQRVGEALRNRDRDSFVLSTKVGRLLQPLAKGEHPDTIYVGDVRVQPVFDFSYDGVMRSFEASLSRLGLNRIDILLIHDPDDHFEDVMRGAYPAVHKLRGEGVVGAIGAGMNQWEMPARFAHETDMDCFLLAGRYTLLDHTGLAVLLPLCQRKGIGIIIGGPYNSGILATGAIPGAKFNYEPASEELLERVRRIEAICAEFGVSMKAAALQFPLAHPAVCSTIPGARSVVELEDNVRLIQAEIPSEFWDAIRLRGLLPESAPVPAS